MLFNKALSKRFFASTAVAKKTALSPINQLLHDLPLKDALLVSSQNIKWTIKELNTYTNAFANHLIELGFQPGNKLLIWSDINHSAEIITATIGAWKAGLSIVFSEYENFEEIEKGLKEADVFLFSPYSPINDKTRIEYVNSKIEEIKQRTNHIIQISHKTLPNMIKFKQAFNYSNNLTSAISLPEVESDSLAYEIISPNKKNILLTHGDIFSKIEEINDKITYGNVLNSAPTFYPSSISLGLLAQLKNKNYVVNPGTYSMREIVKAIKIQKSNRFICEGNLLNIEFPNSQIEEIRKKTTSVESVYVLGNEEDMKANSTKRLEECFPNAKIELFDEFSLRRI